MCKHDCKAGLWSKKFLFLFGQRTFNLYFVFNWKGRSFTIEDDLDQVHGIFVQAKHNSLKILYFLKLTFALLLIFALRFALSFAYFYFHLLLFALIFTFLFLLSFSLIFILTSTFYFLNIFLF